MLSLGRPIEVVLVSTYELGRQPFGLASPAAWLRKLGASVTCRDLSLESWNTERVRTADLIAFFLPMHTATRIAIQPIRMARQVNPTAHLCAYGLYAAMNAEYLRKQGLQTMVSGEFEQALCDLAARISHDGATVESACTEPSISLDRQQFILPDRSDLPPLKKYAQLALPDGTRRVVGYTEATHGCKHLCRHCPVVPVYQGKFRVVQRDIVLADIRQQVAMGAEHITFGDPDFFNGTGHAIPLVEALHAEFESLTYDVTIKVEHLLKHAELLPVLRATGCAFITTAVESVDDAVLQILAKGHTRGDFIEVAGICHDVGVNLSPTFVTFTPWLDLDGYEDLLSLLARLNLAPNVASIQLAIRLLIPYGSRLLELPEIERIIGPFDDAALSYRWIHNDERVDALQKDVEALVKRASAAGLTRLEIFEAVWVRLHRAIGRSLKPLPLPHLDTLPARATIPYLTEPWYC